MGTYYVSPTGNNSSNGLTPGTAWATITRAGSAGSVVTPGSTVNVMAGTYNGNIKTYKNGTAGNKITYRSSDGPLAAKLSANSSYVWTNQGSYCIFDGFELRGANCVAGLVSTENTVGLGLGQNCEFRNLYVHTISIGFCGSSGGIHTADGASNCIVDRCEVGNIAGDQINVCNTMQGIYFSGSGDVITNCLVYKCASVGIQGWHGATNTTIVNNTVFNCDHGILIGQGDAGSGPGAKHNFVANNISCHNAEVGIHGTSGANTGSNIYKNNCTFSNGTNNYVLTATDSNTGGLTTDCKFKNYVNDGTGDYNLSSTSACIGGGVDHGSASLGDVTFPTFDFAGTTRPQGATYDIGAFEFASGDSTAPTLTNATGAATGATTASASVTTDEGNGTMYCWFTTNSTETLANIKASGATLAITSTGVKTFTKTGLTTGTTYYAHFAHTDAAANNSSVANTVGFTPTNTTVYFDLPNATNGSGTSASPKNQTGWAAQVKTAGDTYLFKRGTTSAANAFTLTSGAAGDVIKWGAWYNADGSDDVTKAKPILTTTTVLSAFNGTNNDYVWLDNIKVVASSISVANDKMLMWAGTGSTVSNCVFDSNVGCIGVWANSTISITDNQFFGVSHSSANNNCILLVSSTNMSDITISNNTFKHYGGGGSGSHSCRIEADAGNAVTNLTFSENIIVPNSGVANANLYAIGLRLSNCTNALITSNDIRFHLEGIFASATTVNTAYRITYNTCNSNAHYGIHLSTYAVGCTIDGNTCSTNGTSTHNGTSLLAYGRGIECSSAAGQDKCSAHTIRFNTCNGNLNYGGPLDNGSEGVGIGLDDSTTDCIVYGNTCKDNEGNGIQLYGGLTGTGTPAITDTGGHSIIANYCENNCTAAIKNRRTGGTNTTLFNAHIAVANNFGQTTYIAHNVLVVTTPCGISINASCDDLIIANNIMTSPHGITMDSVYSASVGVCNTNDFFGVGQKYCLRTADVSGSATFAANAYTGTNDLNYDPKWTAAYSLSTGSAAIRTGFAIGTRIDAAGRTYKNPPSLGMFEDFTNPPNAGGNLRKKLYHGH